MRPVGARRMEGGLEGGIFLLIFIDQITVNTDNTNIWFAKKNKQTNEQQQ